MDQRKYFQIGLVALPLGLMALAVFSFVFFFNKVPGEVRDDDPVTSMYQKMISEDDLRTNVAMLAKTIGERHSGKYNALKTVATWLESSLGPSNMGYEVERQKYKIGDQEFVNLAVELPGTSRRDEIVIVGAHYDSVPGSPAANDNGSGVAALISLANVFVGKKAKRTLRFVAFVNEEPPYFQTRNMGSWVYAKRCRERGEKIVAMISLETMGYFTDAPNSQQYPPTIRDQFPTTGNFIAFVGNPKSGALVESAAERFARLSGVPVETAVLPEHLPGVGFSDQWSFWQEGYPAMMVTDTAMFRYPHYHKSSDTPDKLNYPAFFEVVKGMRGVIELLINPRS